MNTQEDDNILDKIRNGDKQALEDYIAEKTPLLFNVAYKVLNNSTDAEDAVSEAWLKFLKKYDTIKKAESVYAWLWATVYRNAIDIIRENRHYSFGSDTVNDEESAATEDSEVLERNHIIECIESLTPIQSETLLLWNAGLKLREIAPIIGRSVPHTWTILNTARKCFIKSYEKQ